MFSSFDIDRGSHLLLKCLVQNLNLEACGSILDLGCGCGVLGLSLKKRYSEAKVTAIDRDALAVAFTRLNARKNSIEGVTAYGRLGYTGPPAFDLVVSNLPAKAGAPVLRVLIGQALSALKRSGFFAFVIVTNLHELAERFVEESGAQLLHRHCRGEHTVFILKGGSIPAAQEPLTPYLRGTCSFQHRRRTWEADTVFNLPEFDSLGFETRLIMDLLEFVRPGATVLIWNPGQGHIARYLAEYFLQNNRSLSLASRDLLQLQITARNLQQNIDVHHRHVPLLEAVEGTFEILIARPDPDAAFLLREAGRLLKPGGQLIVAAKSTPIQRLLKQRQPFALTREKKSRGSRAVLMVRK